MPKQKSDDKRTAIMAAAIRIIASQGLGAATAAIAKEAGVSNGSLFNYFETKADLINQIHRELKTEMAAAGLEGLPTERDTREQALSLWSHWLHWATSYPEKRRTLAHLSVSDDITPESQQIASEALSGIREIMERICKNGSMHGVSPEFTSALMSALADTTIEFMLRDPSQADTHCLAGFEAFWRMVA